MTTRLVHKSPSPHRPTRPVGALPPGGQLVQEEAAHAALQVGVGLRLQQLRHRGGHGEGVGAEHPPGPAPARRLDAQREAVHGRLKWGG